MKKILIDSLVVDVSNLVAYLDNSDDLLVVSLFIEILVKLKKDIVKQEELMRENA